VRCVHTLLQDQLWQQQSSGQELQRQLAEAKAEWLEHRMELEGQLRMQQEQAAVAQQQLVAQHAQQVQELRRQRAEEVGSLEGRIHAVLKKKDAAAAVLRQELEAVSGRLRATEELLEGGGEGSE
jgi:hypothetical protein